VPRVVKGAEAEWGTCSRTVSFGESVYAFSYWNNTIAVGFFEGEIIILDATTGRQMATLDEHFDQVMCLTFSSDGKSLVSGSRDETVNLWDVQTGGIIKTFHGHVHCVWSVSISADCTMIASGSHVNIHLWDIQTQECLCIIESEDYLGPVSFSPTDPQHIISISGKKVQQWDVNGHQIPPTYDGTHIAFSPDHTQFALCNGEVVTVQSSDSGAIMAEFHVANRNIGYWCFSPDGRLVAAADDRTAYVWDITNSGPHPNQTFVGHTFDITGLAFSSPSSLISASKDNSVKFWKIGALSTGPVTTDLGPTPPTLPWIYSVSLQASAGIAISCDAEGMVKTWDISTGLCKESFQTSAKYSPWVDVQSVDGQLIIVWYQDDKIHIWDINKDEFLRTVDAPVSGYGYKQLRISGDGSKVFCLTEESIRAWSMHTGELVGKVEPELGQKWYLISHLQTYDSRIQIQFENSSPQEWDFSISGSPIQLSDVSTKRPLLDFMDDPPDTTKSYPPQIGDIVTGKEVFQLSGESQRNKEVRWDGRYFVTGYQSGEVLIFDFHHMYPQ